MELKYDLGWGNRTLKFASNTFLQNADKSATEITQSLSDTNIYEKSEDPDFEQKSALKEHCSDTF